MMKTEILHGDTIEPMLQVMVGPLAHGFAAGVKKAAVHFSPALAPAQFVLTRAINVAGCLILMIRPFYIAVPLRSNSAETVDLSPAQIGILASLAGLQESADQLAYRGEKDASRSAMGFHARLLEYITNDGGYLDTLSGSNREDYEALLEEYASNMKASLT